MNTCNLSPVLAAGFVQFAEILVILVIVIVGSLLRKINEERERAARAKTVKPPGAPAPPKRENQFRNEIEAFLEEVGRRRAANDPTQSSASQKEMATREQPKVRPAPPLPPVKPAASGRPASSSARPMVDPNRSPAPISAPHRPGADMAARKAPVSQDLGSQVRTHLAEYLDPTRMSQQVRADVGNTVERTLREHLGETVTHGTGEKDPRAAPATAAHPLVALLREPSGMRTAVLVHEVLGRPKGLRRKD